MSFSKDFKDVNVMIMAAGEGTRLRPYTEILPKPAMPFLNVPLASHSLSFLGDLAINKLVVNTFHLPEKIHRLFNEIPHNAKELHFSDEVDEILGNGGGLGNAKTFLKGGGDFIMMNSDEVILPKNREIIYKALAQHKANRCLATLLVMEHPEVGNQFGGVWVDDSNQVIGFGKTAPARTHKGWHYIGVQILSERIFNFIPKYGASNILHDVLKDAIAEGESVRICPFECTWFETGNLHDFLAASKTCMDFLTNPEQSTEKLTLKNTIHRFATTKMNFKKTENLLLAASHESYIESSSQLSGMICIGRGSSISKNCDLKNVIVGDNVRVPEGTRAENTFFV